MSGGSLAPVPGEDPGLTGPRTKGRLSWRALNTAGTESKEPRSVTLLLHCPLRLGLAAGLTQFIYDHGGRILYHEQYVDAECNHYDSPA